jgi:hypothetical protein
MKLKAALAASALSLLVGATATADTTDRRTLAAGTRAMNAPDRASGTGGVDRLNAPCTGTDVDRSSALCAQWVSADAARASAFWAMSSFMAGLATLAAALAAALYAARAANATRDALRHERSLVIPRFEVVLKVSIYAGSNNDVWLSLNVVGDNPARALAFDELVYEEGVLGPREVLRTSSTSASKDRQHLTLHFVPPGLLSGYFGRAQVSELVGEHAKFVASWSCRDVAGNHRRRSVTLGGVIKSRTDGPGGTIEASIEMSAATYDEAA